MSIPGTPHGIELSAAWMPLDAADRAPTVIGPDPIAPVASTGKVAILAALAMAVEQGDIDPYQMLPISPAHHVGGTGLLQALSVREMSVQDLALLTASVSDNIATNVLLERLGLAAVERFLAGAKVPEVAVLDVIRDHRDATVPPAFAVASARGLCTLVAALGRAYGVTPTVRDVVLGWMRHNEDRAYVPDAFGAGPPGLEVVNKTGRDSGVVADTGLVLGGTTDVAYAAVARWSDNHPGSQARAVSLLRDFGSDLHAVASGHSPAV